MRLELYTTSLIPPNFLQHPPSILADLASMLLSNATAHAPTCAAILSLKVPVVVQSTSPPIYYPPQSRCATSPPPDKPSGETRDVSALPLLIHAFVQAAAKNNEAPNQPTRKGNLHFLANVFANISAVRHPLVSLVHEKKNRLTGPANVRRRLDDYFS